MVVVGLWLAIVGYGVAYAGRVNLGGGSCSFLDAFRGRCTAPSGARTASTGAQTGSTLLSQQRAAQQQQASLLGAQPIPQVA